MVSDWSDDPAVAGARIGNEGTGLNPPGFSAPCSASVSHGLRLVHLQSSSGYELCTVRCFLLVAVPRISSPHSTEDTGHPGRCAALRCPGLHTTLSASEGVWGAGRHTGPAAM